MTTGFYFRFHTDDLSLFYNGNLFGNATTQRDFIVFNLDNTYDNTSSAFVLYFESDSKSVK